MQAAQQVQAQVTIIQVPTQAPADQLHQAQTTAGLLAPHLPEAVLVNLANQVP